MKRQKRNRNHRGEVESKLGDNRKGIYSFFSWWITGFLFWVLLTGIKDIPELLFGAGAAILPALLQNHIRAKGLLFFLSGTYRFNPLFLKLPLDLVKDNYVVLKALILERVFKNRRIQGNFKYVKFPVSGSETEDAARCAAYTYSISLVPNTYVIGIDKERQKILIHELVTHPEVKELPI